MATDRNFASYSRLLSMLILCALLLAVRVSYIYLSDAQRFPINKIKITASSHHISHKQIESMLEQYLGVSFFMLPVKELQQQLAHLDWVDKVQVERQWPDSVKIFLVEKESIAIWNDKMLTETGEVFQVNSPIDTEEQLPRLKGLEGQQKQVLQVYKKLSKILTIYGLQAAGLELRDNAAWELTLANGLLLRLGKRDIELRIKRFCKAYKAIFRDPSKSVGLSVDLRYPRGMAVQWDNKRKDNG